MIGRYCLNPPILFTLAVPFVGNYGACSFSACPCCIDCHSGALTLQAAVVEVMQWPGKNAVAKNPFPISI
jgi:hypothetical protein